MQRFIFSLVVLCMSVTSSFAATSTYDTFIGNKAKFKNTSTVTLKAGSIVTGGVDVTTALSGRVATSTFTSYTSAQSIYANVRKVKSTETLSGLVTSIGSTPTTLAIVSDVTVSSNLTIPSTLEILPLNGAKINHGAYTISYASSTARFPDAQVFNGTGLVTFQLGSADSVKVSWFGTDGAAVQKAVNSAATYIKKVSVAPRVYLFTVPLQLPVTATEWGIEISGNKSETKYEALPGSWSTVFRANAAMSAVVTNRSGVSAAYYNVLKNVVLDGNSLAVNGYVNGYQDRLIDSSVIQCTGSGIYFGDMSNSTVLERVTSALNGVGLTMSGDYATVSYINNSNFRQNTGAGIVIHAAIGAHFTNVISEANGAQGLKIYRLASNPNKLIDSLLFTKCYFEKNTEYQIYIGGDTGLTSVQITFDMPLVNTWEVPKGISLARCSNVQFKEPLLTGNTTGVPTASGWMVVDSTTSVISLSGSDSAIGSTGLSLTGTGAANVTLWMAKTAGALGFLTNAVLRSHMQPVVVEAPTARVLTGLECSGSVVTNLGQSAENVIIELPAATEPFSFTAVVSTAQAAHYWRFVSASGGSNLYVNGVLKSYIQMAAPAIGSAVRFEAFIGATGYYWVVTVLGGTWVSG